MADQTGAKPKPRARRKRQASPTTTDPLELALQAEALGLPPDSEARQVLRKHALLLDWQIASERMGVLLKGLTAVAGVAVAAAAVALIVDASRYQGLVVEAFSVPPDLAARGLTGETVAAELLDDLVDMQSRTSSIRAAGSYAIDWGDKTEVEIPQTGVSIGELQRALRDWLGNETRISGVIYRRPDGLAVTARSGGASGQTFTGPETELDALLQKAAEDVYRRTQPYRYAVFLSRNGRAEEALAVFRSLAGGADAEAAWANRGLGLQLANMGRDREGLARLQRAVELEPRNPASWNLIGQVQRELGDEDAALASARKAVEFVDRGRHQDISPEGLKTIRDSNQRYIAEMTGDYLTAAQMLAAEPKEDLYGGTAGAVIRAEAANWLLAHDYRRAARAAGPLKLWNDESAPLRAEDDIGTIIVRSLLARERGDFAESLRLIEDANARMVRVQGAAVAGRTTWPLLSEAYARAGRHADAVALAARTPNDCYRCLVSRGEVMALGGRPAESERAFAAAVNRARNIPEAYQRWGEARLARGDLDGAETMLRKAAELGPRWADPMKAQGDLLARRGQHREAAKLYRRAAERAPRWGALHLAWGQALERAGDPKGARSRYDAAARMHLLPHERTLLRQALARMG